MSSPVVVQGTAVDDFGSSPQPIESFDGHGSKQQTKCRDPLFAALLYINVFAMIAVASVYGSAAFESDADGEYNGFIIAAIVTGIISMLASGAGLAVMMCIPETIIKAALILVIVMAALWVIMSFAAGSVGGGILGLIILAFTLCYARAAWPRIPFASINLVTAITAIKANLGVALLAYFFAALSVIWSIVWAIGFVGVLEKNYTCDESGENCSEPGGASIFFLLLSFFFTSQVIQNSVHVTVAGVVGTWWITPSECSFCGPAVVNSFIRTMTTSFGSVCFGSLLVAILQTLRNIAESARDDGEGGILACIAVCILGCLESLMEYFNKWAFIYVGVFGYSYLEAGKNVFTLFKNRGWEAIIADDLVGNALFLVSLVVGGLMGVVGILLEVATDWFDQSPGNTKLIAFLLGFIIGLVLCSVLLSTVASAVNAVIVLFADVPAEFQQNHPDLSRRMRETWNDIYPGSI